MEGTTLVVTDVDVNDLQIDRRFHFILRSRYRFLTSTAPFKLMVSYKKARNVKQLGAIALLGLEGEIVVQYFHRLYRRQTPRQLCPCFAVTLLFYVFLLVCMKMQRLQVILLNQVRNFHCPSSK